MTYSLSIQAIVDTIHAHAAVHSLSLPPGSEKILAPMLDKSRENLLALLAQNSFASLAMSLGALVTDLSLGDDAGSDSFSITLLTPSSFTSRHHGIVRRLLEQCVAHLTLSSWAATLRDSSIGGMLHSTFAKLSEQSMDALVQGTAPVLAPAVRPA